MMAAPSPPPAPKASQTPGEAAAFTVDALMSGHIRFEGNSGKPVTLTLINRQSGDELMKKAYPDGAIDEYQSLSRYALPPERIEALIEGPAGEVLADLSPESK